MPQTQARVNGFFENGFGVTANGHEWTRIVETEADFEFEIRPGLVPGEALRRRLNGAWD